MTLADQIESYGQAVAARTMTRDDAIHALIQAYDGGLTPTGAADLIDNWQTARSRYENE